MDIYQLKPNCISYPDSSDLYDYHQTVLYGYHPSSHCSRCCFCIASNGLLDFVEVQISFLTLQTEITSSILTIKYFCARYCLPPPSVACRLSVKANYAAHFTVIQTIHLLRSSLSSSSRSVAHSLSTEPSTSLSDTVSTSIGES